MVCGLPCLLSLAECHALGTRPWWAVWVTVPFFCLIEFCSAHTPQFVYKNPETSSVSSPTWSSFLKTVLDFSGPLHLQIKFSISSWASTKMPVGFWLSLHQKPSVWGKKTSQQYWFLCDVKVKSLYTYLVLNFFQQFSVFFCLSLQYRLPNSLCCYLAYFV